jgi:predicted O-methyltransferase YrrM
MTQARRVLEIGTLGGYSTLWMAKALPAGGKVITLEKDPKHAEVAKANVEKAGLADAVEIRVGTALDSLAEMEKEKPQPFDLVFIDADKANNPNYFAWALKWARIGSVLIVDNVVRKGAVLDPKNQGEGVQGTRTLHEMISKEPRVSATALQTVGTKGWDGFVMALVIADS